MSELPELCTTGSSARAKARQRRRRVLRVIMVSSAVSVLATHSGWVPLQAATEAPQSSQRVQSPAPQSIAAAPAPTTASARPTPPEPPPPVPSGTVLAVQTVHLSPAQREQSLSASGNVAAWQEASVSPRTGGLRVARIHAQVGSEVKRGDIMLSFDDDTLSAELDQLKANLAEAEAAANEAQRNASRAQQVGDSGAISSVQLEQFLTAEKTSRARVRALNESIKLQQIRLGQAILRAPDNGIVSHRAATLGAVVPAGMEMFRIIRDARLEWRAEVPASALLRLSPGVSARVLTEDGQTLEGKVRLIAPTVDQATRQGLVYVDLPKGTALKPGMFVRGEFDLGRDQIWVLPQSAVVMRDGLHRVAVVQPNHRVSFVKVGVGRRQGQTVEITSGLDAKTPVVARGAALISDGDAVRVVSAEP